MHLVNGNNKGGYSRKWDIVSSRLANQTCNPIREIVDKLGNYENPNKPRISLSIGDPTVFGNLPRCHEAAEAIKSAVESYKNNGYANAVGTKEAREAIAIKFTTKNAPLKFADVIVTSGCSGALDMMFSVMCNEGDNLLLPEPGFSLYRTISGRFGLTENYYRLKADKNWEIDLEHLASQITPKTRAVVVNNPSNPCGSVWSKEHILEIVKVCEQHKVPIISDEIYFNIVFKGVKCFSFADLSPEVPVFTLGGLAKQYLVPGWRIGWIMIHDPKKHAENVRKSLTRMAAVILGSNTLSQAAIPSLLRDVPQSFYDELNEKLEAQAKICVKLLKEIPELSVIPSQGAMYIMVEILLDKLKGIEDDTDFAQKLFKEEAVVVLPGIAFGMKNYFRIVTCPPEDKLNKAMDRIAEFCKNHKK